MSVFFDWMNEAILSECIDNENVVEFCISVQTQTFFP